MRLEVRANGTGADHVELYLARAQCTQCTSGIQPANVTSKLGGEVWFLDGDAMDGTPETSVRMSAGSAVIDLRTPTPDSDATMPYVLAIGFDAQDNVVGVAKMHDVTVRHAKTEWVKLDLTPAVGKPSSDALTPSGERVWVWRRSDETKAACVGLEDAGSTGVTRMWFVPEDDTDCDEVMPAVECDKYAFHAKGTVAIDNANCTTLDMLSGATVGTCVLGGPACVDGQNTTDNTCTPVDPTFCVPDLFCEHTCASDLPACVGLAQTKLACHFPTEQFGAQCGATAAQTEAEVTLAPLFTNANPGGSMVSCSEVKFADLRIGNPAVSTKLQKNMLQFSRSSVSGDPCSFHLTWDPTTVTSASPPAPITAVLVVTLTNGRVMLLPLVISFESQGCGADTTAACFAGIPLGGDGIQNCLR